MDMWEERRGGRREEERGEERGEGRGETSGYLRSITVSPGTCICVSFAFDEFTKPFCFSDNTVNLSQLTHPGLEGGELRP